MLIANALVMGAGMWWSETGLTSHNVYLKAKEEKITEILSLFNNDVRGATAPYSIQNVAEIGLKDYGIFPGEWYGINTAS
jgi:hypothetical protein